jgi:regulator of CtrA degradation
MHVLAWLLNQRAYRSGELSAGQLARSGRLPDEPPADADNLALLEPATRALIEEGEALHARVARLDREWRANAGEPPVEELRGRITAAFARG